MKNNFKFCLSTDSCSDEFKSYFKNNLIQFLPMLYIENDVEYQDFFDTDEEYINFFNSVKEGKRFSTSGVNNQVATEYFQKILEVEQKDIVHITLSSGLSFTYDACKSAADEINKTSNFKIYVVDSKAATQGQNILLKKAESLRASEKSAFETFEILNALRDRVHHWFFVSDLIHLMRGGRISGLTAIVGTALQMKPIITMSIEGKLEPVEKHIGIKKSIQVLASKVNKYFDKSESLGLIIIPHANNLELANELYKQVIALNLNVEVLIKSIGPVVGSHTGAGALGIVFIANENKFTKKSSYN